MYIPKAMTSKKVKAIATNIGTPLPFDELPRPRQYSLHKNKVAGDQADSHTVRKMTAGHASDSSICTLAITITAMVSRMPMKNRPRLVAK